MMKRSFSLVVGLFCLGFVQGSLMADDYIEISRVTDAAGGVSANEDYISLSAVGQSYHTSTTIGEDFINHSGFINTLAGENYYKVIEGKFNWYEAKADAEARGGHLATIASQQEYEIIKEIAGVGVYYLGASDAEEEGVWKWVTDIPWGYTSWLTGEPNNSTGSTGDGFAQHYLRYNDGIGWDDVNGKVKLGYIIEYSQEGKGVPVDSDGDGLPDVDEVNIFGTDPLLPDTDGDGLTDGYEVGIGRYVMVVPENPLIWPRASELAKAAGHTLLQITDKNEWNSFKYVAKGFERNGMLWIGARHVRGEGWLWEDGREVGDEIPFLYGERKQGGYSGGLREPYVKLDNRISGENTVERFYVFSGGRPPPSPFSTAIGYIIEIGEHTDPTKADEFPVLVKIPSENWDFRLGNLDYWHLMQWPENMKVIKDESATGGYRYNVDEWNNGANITTPKFKLGKNAKLFARYQRTGVSSCQVYVAGADKKHLKYLATNGEAPGNGFGLKVFDLSEFEGQEVYVGINGGSVSIDYMYVEQEQPPEITAPEITWGTPEAITYGDALTGVQLNATADVAGSFTYEPVSGTVLTAGEHTLKATFVPDDLGQYDTAKAEVKLTINKAPLTVTAVNASRAYGEKNPEFPPVYDGFVNDEDKSDLTTPVSASTPATIESPLGEYPIVLSGGEAANYLITLVNGTLTVGVQAQNPGTLLWEFATGDSVYSSPAIGSDGTIYVGANDHKLYALDGETGAKKWEFVAEDLVRSSPAIGSDGTVYVGSNDNKVYALDGKTGSKIWEFVTGDLVYSSPAIGSDGTVYVGSRDRKFYALNGQTGAKIWEIMTGVGEAQFSGVYSSPAISDDGIIYIGAYDAKVYALDGKTGSKIWEFATERWVLSSPAIGDDGTVYIGSYDTKVYALDGQTGAKKWDFVTGSILESSPAIGIDGTVYIASSGKIDRPPAQDTKVYALDGQTGAKKWEFITKSNINNSTPAIGNDGTVYIGSIDNKVYALNGQTGEVKWEFVTGGAVNSSPAIGSDGIIYIGSSDKKVYAITGSSGPADSAWPMFGQNAQRTGRAAGIEPVTPEITWATPEAFYYGEALSEVQLNATADVAGSFTYEPVSGTVLAAGEHALKATFTPDDGALDPVVTEVALVVNPRPLLVQAKPATRVYGDQNLLGLPIISNFAPGEDDSVLNTFPEITTDATVTSPVGTYPITVTGGSAGNYILDRRNSKLTITPAKLMARAPNLSMPYGEDIPPLDVIVSEGFRNEDTADDITPPIVASTEATRESPPGEYPIELSGGGETVNYEITLVNGTLTVEPEEEARDPVITWVAPEAITYGTPLGPNQLNAEASVEGSFVYTHVAAHLMQVSILDPQGGNILHAGKGWLRATFTPADINAYSKVDAEVEFTINKAPLTVTAENASRAYGEPNPEFFERVYEGFVNGDVESSWGNPEFELYTDATKESEPGEYLIRIIFKAPDPGFGGYNYYIIYNPGKLTVEEARDPVITWVPETPIIYGEAIGPDQLNAQADMDGVFVYNPPDGTILDAGKAVLRATFSPTTGKRILVLKQVGNEYARVVQDGQFNPGTYTFKIVCDSKYSPDKNNLPAFFRKKPADAPDPQRGEYTTKELDNGLYQHTRTLVFSQQFSGTFVLSAVGNAPIEFHEISLKDSTGEEILEDPFFKTDSVWKSEGGTVSYKKNPANPSYPNPIEVSADLTINKAELEVTAVNQSRAYREDDPVFEIDYKGFVNGENKSVLSVPVSPTTTAKIDSLPGEYPIVLNGGEADNYNIKLNNGILTIAHDFERGLIAYYPFNGNANDESENGRDGKINGILTSTEDRKGKLGAAYDFGGEGGSVLIDALEDEGLKTGFTYSLWFDSVGKTSRSWQYLINQGWEASGSPIVLRCQASGGSMRIGQGIANSIRLDFQKTGWHQLVLVHDGNRLSAYLNGDFASGISSSIRVEIPEVPINLGGLAMADGSMEYQWNGLLDDVRIYNHALDATEVAALYDLEKTDDKVWPKITWATPEGITYGDALTGVQLNPSVDVDGSFAYEPVKGTVLAAGEHELNVTFTPTDTDKYRVASDEVTLSVQKRSLLVEAQPATRVYGDQNLLGPPIITNFAPGEDDSVLKTFPNTFPVITTDATVTSPVGTYPITVTGGSAGNYILDRRNSKLTITPAKLTARALNLSRPYDEDNPPLEIVYEGFRNEDTTDDITPPIVASTEATRESPPGEYPIVLSGGGETVNYEITLVNGRLSIGRKRPNITWAPEGPITYGTAIGPDQLNAKADAAGIFVYYPPGGAILNAGEVELRATFTPSDPNIYSKEDFTVSLTIKEAPLTVRVKNEVRFYGQKNPKFELLYDGFVNGEDKSVLSSPILADTPAKEDSPAGAYPIVLSGGEADNYDIKLNNGILTVEKEKPLIDWPNPAPITYGEPLSIIQLNAKANVDGDFEYIPPAGVVLNAGDIVLTAYFSPSDSGRYSEAKKDVFLTVQKAPLIVRADNLTRAFGKPNPDLTAYYVGFVNGEDKSVLTEPIRPSTPADEESLAGEYPILLSGGAAANYDISLYDGTLTVGRKPTEIIWEDPDPITYGTAIGPKQLNAKAEVDGLDVDGFFVYNPPGGVVLDSGEDVTLRVTFYPVGRDHSRADKSVALTVKKASLTVRVKDLTIELGSPLPELEVEYEGFVNGEDQDVLLEKAVATVEANPGSPPGNYPIVVSGGDARNYVFDHVNGTLTIRITDTDKDRLSDWDEINKYKTNPNLADTDGDGLSDGEEILDTKTNPLKADTDGDRLKDGAEVLAGTDPNEADTDSDGLDDYMEVVRFKTNALVPDTDGEGLLDGEEVNTYFTNPLLPDTDRDGLTDYEEVMGDPKTDPNKADTDGDGLNDHSEVKVHGTDPNKRDSDGEGLSDGDEVTLYGTDPSKVDTDGDGLTDYEEVMGDPKTNPNKADTDGDGLTDYEELMGDPKTDPNKADTDGDGLTDYDEINKYKTNPLLPDTDKDGLSDWDEINKYKTKPNKADTDGDGYKDGQEIAEGTDPLDPNDFPGNDLPPIIIRDPLTTWTVPNGIALFDVEVDPEDSNYQWFKDEESIAGANNEEYLIKDAKSSDLGAYKVRVSNDAGFVISKEAHLKMVRYSPAVRTPPQQWLIYEPGQTAVVEPVVESEGPTDFEWYKDGTLISGQTEPRLEFENLTGDEAGNYVLKATNTFGTTVSEAMRIVIIDKSKIGKEIRRYRKSLTPVEGTPIVLPNDALIYTSTGEDEEGGSLHLILPNGDPGWVLPFNYSLRGTPAYHEGTVYLLGDPGNLVAVDVKGPNPKVLWTYRISTEEANAEDYPDYYSNSPAVGQDGVVYFGWVDGLLYAVKPDGKLKWDYFVGSDEEERYPEIIGAPAVAKSGNIVFGDSEGYLHSLLPNGGLLWKHRVKGDGRNHEIISRPVLDDKDHIYYGSWDSRFYARYPNGGLKWILETDAPIWVSAVVLDSNTLYVCSDDSTFYALNTENGNIKWKYTFGNDIYPYSAAPVVGLDGSIFIGMTDNKLYAISKTGKKLWDFETEGTSFSSPALTEDARVVFGSKDGTLYVVQGASPVDKLAPWPSYGGGLFNRGRIQEAVQVELPPESKPAVLEVQVADLSESLRLKITGTPSFNYVIQTSFDLIEWIDMEPIRLSEQGSGVQVVPSNKASYQFFRLRENE